MKKTIAWALIMMLALSLALTGCSSQSSTETDGRVSIKVAFPDADETWTNDDYYRYICDQVNMDIEFEPLSSSSATEKARIWISSGTMPDVVGTDLFMMDEYLGYVNQGMIKKLPDNWEEDYPNVAFAMEMSGILDSLKAGTEDGSVAVLVRPQDHYRDFIDEFRTAFANDEDLVEMMGRNEYLYIDSYGFAYRKDWAEQLGIETDYIMDYDDVMDMIRKFKEADLGGVGAKNTVGLAVDHTEAPQVFMIPFHSGYKDFTLNENGEYEYGLLTEEATEGVKAYAKAYEEGILAPDFYTQKSSDLNALFCSERSGVIFPKANVAHLRVLCSDFEKSNPGKKAEDCIAVCWMRSPDGTIHGWEGSNYWGAYYFSPELSDEEMAKILELADYISSEEGGPQIRMGVPDVDYKKEGDEYINLREAGESGVVPNLDEKYPSYTFFRKFLNCFYEQSVDTNPYAKSEHYNLRDAKLAGPLSIRRTDLFAEFYVAEDYVNFKAANDVNEMLATTIVAEGDPMEVWKQKVSAIEQEAKSVADNMNKAFRSK